MSEDTLISINEKDKAVKDFIASNMDGYTEHVIKLKEAHSSELISNGRPEHAKILIRYLIEYAQKELRLFSSALREDVYNDDRVVDALVSFLDKTKLDPESKIKILLQNATEAEALMASRDHTKNRFFKYCIENEDKCEIKVVIKNEDLGIKSHFLVVDKAAYRFCKNKDILEAVATFNRPEKAGYLVRQFEELFESGISIWNLIGKPVSGKGNQHEVAAAPY